VVIGPIIHAAPKAPVKAPPKTAKNPAKPLPKDFFEPGEIIRRGKQESIPVLSATGESCSTDPTADSCNMMSQFTPPSKALRKKDDIGTYLTFSISYPNDKKTDAFKVYLSSDNMINGVTVETAEGSFTIPLSDSDRIRSIADILIGQQIAVKEPPKITKK
jgi:hypothetical protein